MANEVRVRTSVVYIEDGVELPLPVREFLSSAAEHFTAGRLTLNSAADELVPLGDTLGGGLGYGVFVLWNTSSVVGEFVDVKDGTVPGVVTARVYPGECFAWRPSLVSQLYLRAAANSPKVRWWYFENA